MLVGMKSNKLKLKNLVGACSSKFECGTIGGWTDHSENNGATAVIASIENKGGFDCLYMKTAHTAERTRRWYDISETTNGEVIAPNETFILRYKYYDSTRGLTVSSSTGSRWYTTNYLNGPTFTAVLEWQQYESAPFVIPYEWIGLVMDEVWDARINIRDVELIRV